MKQQTPITAPPSPTHPRIKNKAAQKEKTCHFPIVDFWGRGDLGFPFILSKTALLDRIKWNSKPPIPQFKDEVAPGATT